MGSLYDEALTAFRVGKTTEARQLSELALERAQYDADRAELALLACEPENRLVARSLESRWEAKLAGVADAKLSWRHWPPICPPCGQLPQRQPRIASD